MRCLRYVVHHDVLDTLCAQLLGNGFRQFFGIAIHRSVCNDHTFLAFVPAQAVIQVNYLRNLLRPYRSVGRTNHLNIKSLAFLQSLLYRIAEFTDNVRVIPTHLTFVDFGIDILIDTATVQCTKATKRISRKQDTFGFIERNHRLGPMYHWYQVETQIVMPQFQEITFPHYITVASNTIETFHHIECFLVAHQYDIGIILLDQGDRTRMVRLHMVNNQVIDFTVTYYRLDFLQIYFEESHINRIYQCHHLVIGYQIRVIRHSVW